MKVPVALIKGTDDRFLTPEDGVQARKYLSTVFDVEVPAAGHWPMIDQAEQFETNLLAAVESLVTGWDKRQS